IWLDRKGYVKDEYYQRRLKEDVEKLGLTIKIVWLETKSNSSSQVQVQQASVFVNFVHNIIYH
ncbi:8200_t:CDS:2, partial [Racocetra persica]